MANPLTQAYSGGSVGTGAGKAGGERAPSPGAARRPSGSGVSDDIKDTVKMMQQLMFTLSTELNRSATSAIDKIREINPNSTLTAEELQREATHWSSTSAGGKFGSFDGIWGSHTKGSLNRIKNFVTENKFSDITIQEGVGNIPYREMDKNALKQLANDNIVNLRSLFRALGMSSSIPATGNGRSSFNLDRIKAHLTTEDATTATPWSPDSMGTIPVTVGDMVSIDRFFKFIQQLTYTPCKRLESESNRNKKRSDIRNLANIILDDSLINLAQSRTGATGASSGAAANRSSAVTEYKMNQERASNQSAQQVKEDTVNKPADDTSTTETLPTPGEEVGFGELCFNTVDDIFKWFYYRAHAVLAQVQNLKGKQHPFYPRENGIRLVNDQDEAAASAYLAAADKLWNEWSSKKDNIIRKIRDRGMEDRPIVTLDMIQRHLESPGAGRRRSEDRGEGRRGIGAETISYDGGGGEDSIRQRSLRGPIREFMPLNWLLESDEFRDLDVDTSKLEELSKDGRIPDIHRQVWRQGNWVNLAIQNIKGSSNTEKLNKFSKWAGAIRDVLYELYANWESSNRANLSEQIIAQQNRELNRWGDAITSIISRSQRGMPDAVKRYGD